MSRFSRYMLISFFKSFLMVIIGAVIVFVVIDFVSNIRMWLNRGFASTGEYYLNYLPNIVYLVSPIAILISVISVLGNMARHLELSAVQGAGRSVFRMLIPLLMVGVLLTGGLFVLGEYVLPDANHRRLEIAQTAAQRRKAARIKDKAQFAFVSSQTHTWYFHFYSSLSRKARGVILMVFDDGRIVERYDGRHMYWDDDDDGGHWVMRTVFHRRFFKDGSMETIQHRKLSLAGIVNTLPEDLIDERQTADEMSSTMIKRRMEVLRRSGEETHPMETQWHFKYSGPLMMMITLLLGAALAHRYNRSGGISQKFVIGLFVAFSYYVSFRLGLQMGEGGVLSPWLGAWIANLLFGSLAVVMLVRSFRL